MAAALEAASSTEQIKAFYDSKAFAPVFLKGEALQQSLADTWARIEPSPSRPPKNRPRGGSVDLVVELAGPSRIAGKLG